MDGRWERTIVRRGRENRTRVENRKKIVVRERKKILKETEKDMSSEKKEKSIERILLLHKDVIVKDSKFYGYALRY